MPDTPAPAPALTADIEELLDEVEARLRPGVFHNHKSVGSLTATIRALLAERDALSPPPQATPPVLRWDQATGRVVSEEPAADAADAKPTQAPHDMDALLTADVDAATMTLGEPVDTGVRLRAHQSDRWYADYRRGVEGRAAGLLEDKQ